MQLNNVVDKQMWNIFVHYQRNALFMWIIIG